MSQRKFTNAKIVIFGGPGVGKTAFAVRYITKRFICDYDSDKEMMYTYKLSAAKDDITIEILDTTSKPSDDVMEKHIKWGEGFILIYSVIDKSSLEEAIKAQERIAKIKGTEVPAVLVGNKCDLLPSRDAVHDDAQDTAGTLDCPKFQISVAESSGGVLEVMEELLCQLKREFVKNVSASTPVLEKPKSKLYSMKRAFKKRINRSHSDTF
ncbi:hypothetical protein ACJMK2_029758 [Sinanodonta woodiana]|uniref:small monomeric GTPase n=1 Tax=Sinanodonta woodiana TaxID=1069815 RepID=A0ABD3XD39_SINWO